MSRPELYPLGMRGGNVTILGVASIAKQLDECRYAVRYHCCGAEKTMSHKRFRTVLKQPNYLGSPVCRHCCRHGDEIRRQLALAGQSELAPEMPWLPPYGCANVAAAWPVPPSLGTGERASGWGQP